MYTVVTGQVHMHANRFYSEDCCRVALATRRRSLYLFLARELNEGLNILEEKLCKTDLPLKHQHWAMFSVLEAYLCLWQCCEALKDTKKLQPVCCKRSLPAANDTVHLDFPVTAAVYMVQNINPPETAVCFVVHVYDPYFCVCHAACKYYISHVHQHTTFLSSSCQQSGAHIQMRRKTLSR